MLFNYHDDAIKWKHFPRYWPFVRGIHRSPVNSRHKGQWRGALVFSLTCAWINGWINNREAGDLGRHRAHADVTVMLFHLHPSLSLPLPFYLHPFNRDLFNQLCTCKSIYQPTYLSIYIYIYIHLLTSLLSYKRTLKHTLTWIKHIVMYINYGLI